jgi:hypothetical protein
MVKRYFQVVRLIVVVEVDVITEFSFLSLFIEANYSPIVAAAD